MNDLKRAYQVASLVHISILATLVIYVFVVEIIKARLEHFLSFVDPSAFTNLRYALYAVAVLDVVLIRFSRGMVLRKRASDDRNTLRSKLMRSAILTAALCEVPAIFGLVLFFVAGSVRDFYYLSLVSLILVFLYFPRYRNWEEWIMGQLKT